MDKLIEQIILQAPTVAVLVYIVREQERRMNELMDSVLDCLNSRKNAKNDHTYTYPE
jgi:hypothetical protein